MGKIKDFFWDDLQEGSSTKTISELMIKSDYQEKLRGLNKQQAWWKHIQEYMGVPLSFCQEQSCIHLCYSKRFDRYTCGKHGGKPIGSIKSEKCPKGFLYEAITVLTGDDKKFLGVDHANDDKADAMAYAYGAKVLRPMGAITGRFTTGRQHGKTFRNS